MAKPVNEVTATKKKKKRGYYHQWKYKQQKANKDQKGINGEKY